MTREDSLGARLRGVGRSRFYQALLAVAAIATVMLGAPELGHAAAFKAGDLVVYRVGNGTEGLTE